MQSGLHAVGWGLQRLGLALGLLIFLPIFLYAILVMAIVVFQAAVAFGQ
jgi:hypothetical protein